MFKTYTVWRRAHSSSEWIKTGHIVKARTDQEAQTKLAQKFKNCGFSSMSILAVEQGLTP